MPTELIFKRVKVLGTKVLPAQHFAKASAHISPQQRAVRAFSRDFEGLEGWKLFLAPVAFLEPPNLSPKRRFI
jgi:hypothetical protein